MNGYQKHILIGNLGADPVTYETRSGKTVTNFDIAVNERNADGSEVTTWFRVAAWNGLGETCAQYLSKGRLVMVEATRIRASAYSGSDGEPRAGLEVTADSVQFLDSPRDEEPVQQPVNRRQGRGEQQTAQGSRAGAARRGNTRNRRGQVERYAEQAHEEIPF